MTTDSPESPRAARLNVTVRPETYARLQEARNKRSIEINVSQLADAAINAELDRRERGPKAQLVARFSVESDRRRGPFYTRGHEEGLRWASEVACWAEVCGFAILSEDDVSVEGNGFRRTGPLTFTGRFHAPGDYPAAPSFDIEEEQVHEFDSCDQYWRGWLAGVLEVFNSMKGEVQPIDPVIWDGSETVRAADLLSEDIPF